MVNDQTKGPGGSRVGAGFNKGDTLTVAIYDRPDLKKVTVNLLQYTSPDGPFHVIVKDTSDNFTYTVPENTRDFIYINFSGAYPGMTVTWSCASAIK